MGITFFFEKEKMVEFWELAALMWYLVRHASVCRRCWVLEMPWEPPAPPFLWRSDAAPAWWLPLKVRELRTHFRKACFFLCPYAVLHSLQLHTVADDPFWGQKSVWEPAVFTCNLLALLAHEQSYGEYPGCWTWLPSSYSQCKSSFCIPSELKYAVYHGSFLKTGSQKCWWRGWYWCWAVGMCVKCKICTEMFMNELTVPLIQNLEG